MSREILKNIIDDFSIDKFNRFFRNKSLHYAPKSESLEQYNDEDFTKGLKLGQIDFPGISNQLIVCVFKVSKELSDRSGKKVQYDKGKKILKDFQKDAGIFIFYDKQSNFRFSLIYTNYLGRRRDWSTFKRFTYFVSKEFTNKTFLQRIGTADFTSLENIKDAFSVEKVTKDFYNEVQNWYFWAINKSDFPDDEDKNKETRNAKNLIRLIARIIFIWFMKVKKLIPESLFDKNFLDNILDYTDKTSSTYYKAILQNLFFATLNTQMKKDDSKSRIFIDEAKKKGYINDGYLQQGYYRYKRFIKNIDLFLEQFQNIPFLNGGLFDCLDKRIGSKEIRIDCFSDNPKNEVRLKIPDELFFLDREIDVDLKKYYEPKSNKRVIRKVRGLLEILKSYNFTIDENTPIDEEVALDPELLGKVFENLLASYNPETKTTARKATGSYYTPREIVNYMVDESLFAYLKTVLSDNSTNLENNLRTLFDYNIETNPFANEKDMTPKIIDSIERIKILDPACGSGAFPMGVLHKLVLILHKLDPKNKYWYELQYQKAIKETEEAFKLGDKQEREERLKEINDAFDTSINDPNYARKLFLIRNCIYGVDIQEIAVQISKLRFFISLLIDQQTNDCKSNRGIKALPNLETKFVAANTLIGLAKLPDELFDIEVRQIIEELFKVREDFFYANSRKKKKELERKEEKLKTSLIVLMQKRSQKINKDKILKFKIEIDKLNKEFNKLIGQPDEIEEYEISDFFGNKKMIAINKTEEKRREIKRNKLTYENELIKIENQIENPDIEIAKKMTEFNPYDQNKSNSWFDVKWMFGVNDGFDIVIGNPPWGASYSDEYKNYFRSKYESAKSITGKQKGSIDSFSLFIDKGLSILNTRSILNYIVPMSITSSDSMIALHNMLFKTCENIWMSSYSDRPKKIFDNSEQAVTIIHCNKNNNNMKNLFTTKVNKRYTKESIQEIINNLKFINSKDFVKNGRVAKIGLPIEVCILKKIFSIKTTIKDFISDNGKPIYYRSSGGRYYNIITNFSVGSTKEKPLFVKNKYRDLIGAILSSNLNYWFYHIYSDNLDMKKYELEIFPVPVEKFNASKILEIEKLYDKYLLDLEQKSKIIEADYVNVNKIKIYYARYSKHIIDKIDLEIKDAYGLTDKEIDFIINYDLKFRTDEKE